MEHVHSFIAVLRVGGATIYPLLFLGGRRRGGDRREGVRLCGAHPSAGLGARRGRDVRLRLGGVRAAARRARPAQLFRPVLPGHRREPEATGVVGRIARDRGGEPDRAVAQSVAVGARDHRHRRAAPRPARHDHRHDPGVQAVRRRRPRRSSRGDRRGRRGPHRDRRGPVHRARGALRVQLLLAPTGAGHGRDGAARHAARGPDPPERTRGNPREAARAAAATPRAASRSSR